MTTERYHLTLEGLTPFLMHAENRSFADEVLSWRKDPANKERSVPGDDRSPAWTWLGYTYHDGRTMGIPSDNLMTMLREGGAKVKVAQGKGTYKKQTQAGIVIDQLMFDFFSCGQQIPWEPIARLRGEPYDFWKHEEVAKDHGFELHCKPARIKSSKHIRVRPMFRDWAARGTITVIDSEVSGITQDVLQVILNQAGALCGIGDWRPSSPSSGGSFGKFRPILEKI